MGSLAKIVHLRDRDLQRSLRSPRLRSRRLLLIAVLCGLLTLLRQSRPAERSSAGAPSPLDFLLCELPDIVEVFATESDSLPGIFRAPSYVRTLLGRGQLVKLSFVAGRLTDDGIVELRMIEL